MSFFQKGIVCVGDPLIDHCLFVPDSFLEENKIPKGGTPKYTKEFIDKLLQNFEVVFSGFGGSAANVAKGLGFLGSKVGLHGQCSNDKEGQQIRDGIKEYNIDDLVLTNNKGRTGKVIACIHPDSQRTMFGIFEDGYNDKLPEEIIQKIESYEYLLFDGYQLVKSIPYKTLTKLVERILPKGRKIIAVLSDVFWMNGYKNVLKSLTDKSEIITGTEDEFMKLFDKQEREELLRLLEGLNKELIAVTMGKDGAYLIKNGKRLFVPIQPNIKAIDTVGAGDYFTSGLLHSYLKGYSLEVSGKVGAMLAGDIVSRIGNKPGANIKQEIQEFLNKCKVN